MNVAIRGFSRGARVFDEVFDLGLERIEVEQIVSRAAERHTHLLDPTAFMIEIEFLDEPNLLERFFRFGSDPGDMVMPVAIRYDPYPD